MPMVALFWFSVCAVLYAYFGYPLMLLLIILCRKQEVKVGDRFFPSVAIIITAHNESKRIEKKLQNTLQIEYPKDRLDIIVASDASSDTTDQIVTAHSDKGIHLVRSPYRGGKEFAQRCAIEQSSSEIIVFTDVATMLERDGIKKIVSNFADPSIGCVSSQDRFIDEQGQISGEGAYVRYEMWLRSLETKVHSVVGLSGSFFAARRQICRDWPTDIPSDFSTLLNAIRADFRGISDPRSIGMYPNIQDERREFERKVRTITRGISALMAHKALLNPFRYGLFSWQIFSHKLMRWLVPWFLILAFISNFALATGSHFYRLLFIPHIGFYVLAIAGSRLSATNTSLKVPSYFMRTNCAIAISWIKYIKGDRFVTWTPSTR